jgi:rhodanese-related sulfurtransferase/voltage-gated potassium channel Kch
MTTETNQAGSLPDFLLGIPEIPREELQRRLHDPALTIVDVLPAESYASGHLPRALNLPLDLIAGRAQEILPDLAAEIVVYCGNLECERSERALRQLQELGYTNVRDYRAGLADWIASGGPIERNQGTDSRAAAATIGPSLQTSSEGTIGRGPARISLNHRDTYVLELIQEQSTVQLFLLWIGMILLSGVIYWLFALINDHILIEEGSPVGGDLKGLVSSLYFSFVTATSVGYGDIVPIGFARVIAVGEAVAGLLVFGAVIAKLVSHRQDQLVGEIYRVTFEERLDRVQTNLHMVISELLAIISMCEGPQPRLRPISARLDSATLIFQGEVRSIHDLLLQPRLMVEEGVLGAILASLASALSVLSELLQCLPAGFARSEPLAIALQNLRYLAEDICSSCVPHDYTPRLVFWMDRIQATAGTIK